MESKRQLNNGSSFNLSLVAAAQDYQREQLLATGTSRAMENAHLDMLRRLQKFTADQVFQQCTVSQPQDVSLVRNWDLAFDILRSSSCETEERGYTALCAPREVE